MNNLIKSFHDSHMRDYDHAFEDQNIEIITLRVIAFAATEKLSWSKQTNNRWWPQYFELFINCRLD